MTGPEGNSEFCFPRISMFSETKSKETLRFEGDKIHCSLRDHSLSDLLYSKTNGSNRWKTNNRGLWIFSTSTRSSTRTTFQFYFAGFALSQHVPISSHELPSLPKTNMTNWGSRNVTDLKIESRTRTQSRTRSQI